jgi:Mannosyl-glycoprotein endo-beta-N-acetylglucosaminidase/LysM domain
MQKIKILLVFVFLLSAVNSHAQNAEVIKKYIHTYKDLAVSEMLRTGVPASITLAQGIHESGAGIGKLALMSNNHFGIKCKSNWTGETVKHNDDAKGECFRKYETVEESFKDHSDFLKSSQRYSSLFSLDPTDYEGWSKGLKNAGYATNPKYPQVLIKLIEVYDYTLIAVDKMPADIFPTKNTPELVINEKTSVNSQVSTVSNIAEIKKSNQPTYPEGVFRINETKVIYVKSGTSFLAIANQHNIDLSRIFEFNEISISEAATRDQLIYLQRKRKTGNNQYHIVQPGESLHEIAQQEAIRLESLLELNWLKEGMQPAIGEQLSLQRKSETVPKLILKDNYSFSPAVRKQ